jgi:hypothetical protein
MGARETMLEGVDIGGIESHPSVAAATTRWMGHIVTGQYSQIETRPNLAAKNKGAARVGHPMTMGHRAMC